MSRDDGSLILSAIGITNTIGRILCGIIATHPKINLVILHFGFLSFGAFLNLCVVFLRTKEAFFVYAALYGFVLGEHRIQNRSFLFTFPNLLVLIFVHSAEQGSLRSIILVKLVGLENLTNAFGILLLFLGVFTAAGTPSAGTLIL